ncbi:GNAT family N-acetyltransferase [Streptacidiphilus rugosus]|uniref:GNAT family N-acetyltransferase n=1 Tax=Streptacidiphilus rugosus TaxID=405783 RepID=UPI000559EACF|nr:GNAT family N-acetyltransferase [Streptacidiphilus rugosus]
MDASNLPWNASPTASPELRIINADDFEAWYASLVDAFGGVPEAPEEAALWQELTELDRSIGAFDAKTVVGSAGAFSFGLAVPGGAETAERPLVPAAGVTMVGVRSTHRRRGLLSAMMRSQLDDVRGRGEPVAVLTASEPAIYGRFGYGLASLRVSVTMDRHRVRIADPGLGRELRLSQADPVESLAVCEELYARVGPTRAGWLRRPAGWEKVAVLDPSSDRDGHSPLFCVLVEDPVTGGLGGYARYAVKPSWDRSGPNGSVRVRELYAASPEATAALWRYLLDVDLTDTVTSAGRPVDDALLSLVDDPRRCGPVVGDGIYLRPVEVGAALGARGYYRPVDLVLEVEDAFCPWNTGRWRLSADGKGAVCERTTDPADLALTVRELGAAYLGGVTLRSLATAGRVRELRAGALAAASAAFATDLAPWLPRGF